MRMRTLPFNDINPDSLREFVRSHEPFLLTDYDRNNTLQPIAVVVTYDEYRSMLATLQLASEPERLMKVLNSHQKIQKEYFEGFTDDEEFIKSSS